MDAFFTNLGRTVLERWKRENFALTKFPAIAQAALDERPPVAHVDLSAFLREFLLNDEQAFQTRSGFGQPELVVYHHSRFYIQVLFWLDGTTDIHQHEFSRREQILDALAQIEDPDYSQLVLDMIRDSDFERGFGVLRECHDHLRSLGEWQTALAVFQDKHGALAAGIAATLEEIERRNVIIGLRSTISEPEHRFFLALLLNIPTRADLLVLVAQRFPEEAPVETVVRWAEELMAMSDDGAEILDARFPVTLATPNEAQPHLFLATLRYFLEGGSEAPAPLRSLALAELEQLRAALAASSLGMLLRG